MPEVGNLGKWRLKSGPTVQVVGTVLAELTFARRDHTNLHQKTFYVYNGGVGTLKNAVLEWSNDEVTWGTLDATTFANLGSGVLKYGDYFCNHRFYRFRATGSNDGTTIDGTASGSVITATLTGWWNF